jgi:signal transduction histidine kinase/CheY-like chemotaxis protein
MLTCEMPLSNFLPRPSEICEETMPPSVVNNNISTAIFDEHLAEIGQAKTRLWLTLACIVYLAIRWIGGGTLWLPDGTGFVWVEVPADMAIHLLLFSLGYGVFGLTILAIIRRRPGHFMGRRLTSMLGDYGVLTYTLIMGELVAMPCFALILWTTISHGMRFGRRYLAIGALLAQVSLFALVIASPYWQSQIALILTFSLTAGIVPAFAFILLRRTANARDEAYAATLAKSRFLAQASHDLRQPIHAIGYYLDILRTTTGKVEQSQQIDKIEKAVGSVSRLFKSLLDIAHLDSGTVEVKAEIIALQPLLTELIQQNEQSAQWNGSQLRAVRTSLNVVADSTLLTTMLQNLLSNAIKYGHGSKILIGVRRIGSALSIEVHDQGIGIEAEHMPHIFEEFYRAHVAGDRDTEGVGLGLAIVNRLAQLSGFSFDLQSKRGVGTTARIFGIPITTQKIAPERQARNRSPQPLSGFRVILIEDDHDVRDATGELLERWGCTVQAHATLPPKVDMADLILADFDLGHQKLGTDAIAAIRKELGYAAPAILMTGHAETILREQTVSEDIQILAKPLQPAMLRSVLSAFRIASRQQT